MSVDIFIRDHVGKREIQIPWLPEKIEYESGGTIRATYDILNKGPVEVPTGTGLAKYSWESTFPVPKRKNLGMTRGVVTVPAAYHNIIEDWRKKGTSLTLQVVGYPINTKVIIDDYKATPTGAFGEMDYEISFIEDRDITVQVEVVKEETPPKRSETVSSAKTYTVKSGDCMWNIALKHLKNGARWPEIYQLNKDVIEKTAKKYGRKNSNNGWWIYPGTVLSLPS